MNENEKIEIVFYKDNKGFKVPLQTKSEAIEKMAKKIDEAYIDKNGCNKGLTMEELAEAALNALLEDNK